MHVKRRVQLCLRPWARHRGALGGLVFALAACDNGPARINGLEALCGKCDGRVPPLPPFPASHHGIVRGTVRDPAGAPVAGVYPFIIVRGPAGPGGSYGVYNVEGVVATPADGSFRMTYTLGLGSDPSAARVQAGANRHLGSPSRQTAVSGYASLPAPRPVSERPDSATVVIVMPAGR